jgi:predicted transposase YdaD
MQLIPIDEAVREIQIRDAKEEKAFEVAQKFLKMGLPVEQIAQGTGLSIEELSALRQ